MRTLKLTLAYDGAAFHGWQIQPGRRTLQQTMQDVLAQITGQPVSLAASGRTDAGVHALAQVASFETESALPADVLQRALNAELPRDVCLLAIEEATAGFHARRHATGKRYRYAIHHGPLADVFARNYAWHLYRPLDVAAMRRAAEPLVGTHDFASFQTSGSERSTTVRTVFELSVCETSPGSLSAPGKVQIEIAASGFLYNMVRNIVGTLVEVGRGMQIREAWPAEVLVRGSRSPRRGADRAAAGSCFLVKVDFA